MSRSAPAIPLIIRPDSDGLSFRHPPRPVRSDRPDRRGRHGEVYGATDTTLNRQVAIRVLPETVGRDALLDWCKEHGLMGIVPHQAALMAPWWDMVGPVHA